MRTLFFLFTILSGAAACAADWKVLPSPPDYQATVDLDSVKMQQKWGLFTVSRTYTSAQSLPPDKEYHSTRLQYVTDCNDGSTALVLTQYYGEDRKLIQYVARKTIKRAEFALPKPGSDIAEALKLACERLAKGVAGSAKPAPGGSSSGSGLVISRDGYILTNQHVVQQCGTYEVIDDKNRTHRAALEVADNVRDLALLTVKEKFPTAASLRKAIAPQLGENIIVVGYPLVAVLGTRPSVGFGHVTSTVGVRDNPAQMQISVPVQRGNSGGPVLDQAGNVIGIVVSKLDALKLAQSTGDLPQNVNFAIKGDVVRAFLESNKIEYETSADTAKLENTEIASRGAAVTVLVRCIRHAAAAQ
jgi:S1-C subfamily serine protease